MSTTSTADNANTPLAQGTNTAASGGRGNERSGWGGRGRGRNTGGRGGRGNGTNWSTTVTSTDPITFSGANEDVGVVLGLRMERFHKKWTFLHFKQTVYNYVLSNYKDGQELMPVFKKGEDPMAAYTGSERPETLGPDADDIDKAILSENIKQYVTRMSGVKRNMTKAYGLFWGQCSAALQAQLKGLNDYAAKSDELNLTWLLGELK